MNWTRRQSFSYKPRVTSPVTSKPDLEPFVKDGMGPFLKLVLNPDVKPGVNQA